MKQIILALFLGTVAVTATPGDPNNPAITLQLPPEEGGAGVDIDWDGTTLTVPQHTDKIAWLEGNLTALQGSFNALESTVNDPATGLAATRSLVVSGNANHGGLAAAHQAVSANAQAIASNDEDISGNVRKIDTNVQDIAKNKRHLSHFNASVLSHFISGPNVCANGTVLFNDALGWYCQCDAGYKNGGQWQPGNDDDYPACIDVDECDVGGVNPCQGSTTEASCTDSTSDSTHAVNSYTCDCTGTGFQGTDCTDPAPCADAFLANSNYDSGNKVTGVYGDVVTVTCDQGYSSGATRTTTCQKGGTFSAMAACTADPCVVDSTSSLANGIACENGGTAGGVTGSCSCNCAPGYSHGSNNLCETPNTCTPTQFANSNYKADGSVQGTTLQNRTVECDDGYSGDGIVTCQTDGTFSTVTCTALPCTAGSDSSPNTIDCLYGGVVGGVTGACTCDCTNTEGFTGARCNECAAGKGYTVENDVEKCVTCDHPKYNLETTHTATCSPQSCGTGSGVTSDDENWDPTSNNNCEVCSTGYSSAAGFGQCNPNSCTAASAANSNKKDTGAITGVTGETVDYTCDDGYSGGTVYTATCGTGGTFSFSGTCDEDACGSPASHQQFQSGKTAVSLCNTNCATACFETKECGSPGSGEQFKSGKSAASQCGATCATDCFETATCGSPGSGEQFKSGKSATSQCGTTCATVCFEDKTCGSPGSGEQYKSGKSATSQCGTTCATDCFETATCGSPGSGQQFKSGKSATSQCGTTCATICFEDKTCGPEPSGEQYKSGKSATSTCDTCDTTDCFEPACRNIKFYVKGVSYANEQSLRINGNVLKDYNTMSNGVTYSRTYCVPVSTGCSDNPFKIELGDDYGDGWTDGGKMWFWVGGTTLSSTLNVGGTSFSSTFSDGRYTYHTVSVPATGAGGQYCETSQNDYDANGRDRCPDGSFGLTGAWRSRNDGGKCW